MNDDIGFIFGVGVIIATLFFAGANTCGRKWGREDLQQEAIKAGVATYECNKEAGLCKFVWVKK